MPKKKPIKTDLSFDELLDLSVNTPPLKKGLLEPAVLMLLNQNVEQAAKKKPAKKKPNKKAVKKSK